MAVVSPANELDDSPAKAPPKPRAYGAVRRAIFILSILYGLSILCVWALIHHEGERWWIATLLLFGPRLVLALPLFLLIPLALVFNRRSLWILGLDVYLVLFPLLGFCIPWRTYTASASSGPTIRILTCNIHDTAADTDRLAQLIADTHPDIVTLQEFSPGDKDAVFAKTGPWNIVTMGGLCLATHYKITYKHLMPESHRATYEIQVPGGAIDYYNIHLASPHYSLSDAAHGESDGADEVEANSSTRLFEARDLTRRAIESGSDVILSGDFNLPCDSPIYRQTVGRFTDAFSTAGFGFGFSYRTHRTMVRIDHILTGLDWRCQSCWLGPSIGSPHRPVIADLQRIHPASTP